VRTLGFHASALGYDIIPFTGMNEYRKINDATFSRSQLEGNNW